MNAHIVIGGDLFIMTVDGVVPLSQAITKDSGQLDQAMVSRPIKPMWREEVVAKRAYPWTIKKWDEYGGGVHRHAGRSCRGSGTACCSTTRPVPGRALPGTQRASCEMRADMFFGTQNGIVMQADRTGYDDGQPYVATLVGGWELFGAAAQVVWHQARAIFTAGPNEPFEPQLAATVDYGVVIPPPPPAGIDPGAGEGGTRGSGTWRTGTRRCGSAPTQRSTLWVSIGMSGYAHAPIVQVTVAQVPRARGWN